MTSAFDDFEKEINELLDIFFKIIIPNSIKPYHDEYSNEFVNEIRTPLMNFLDEQMELYMNSKNLMDQK